jgi:hypothetical protein
MGGPSERLHHRCSISDGAVEPADVACCAGGRASGGGGLAKPAAAATTAGGAHTAGLLRAAAGGPPRALTPLRASSRGARPGLELLGAVVHLPRATPLRLLGAAIALLIFVQAVSCGLFFCVALPFGHHHAASYVDVRDIVSDVPLTQAASGGGGGGPRAPRSGAAAAAAPGGPAAGAAGLVSTPKLIPRVLHQTYRSKRLPRGVPPLLRSWRGANGGWEVRFYDDVAAHAFVQREFPEYLEAYLALPKDVERADFFK